MNLKFLVGGSLTFSANAENAGDVLLDGGRTGVIIVGKEVVGASDAVLTFYQDELGPGIASTSGDVVMVAEQGGQAMVDFTEKAGQDIGTAFESGARDIADGAGKAASDVGRAIVSFGGLF